MAYNFAWAPEQITRVNRSVVHLFCFVSVEMSTVEWEFLAEQNFMLTIFRKLDIRIHDPSFLIGFTNSVTL
jgi:hypothetical protein